MKPVVITAGKRPVYNQDKNRLTLEFFFPAHAHETGEIDLINGDIPRIVIKASPLVQIDRVEKEEKKKRK